MSLSIKDVQEIREYYPELATASFSDAPEEIYQIAEKAKKAIKLFYSDATIPDTIEIYFTQKDINATRGKIDLFVFAGIILVNNKPLIICNPKILTERNSKEILSIFIHEMVHVTSKMNCHMRWLDEEALTEISSAVIHKECFSELPAFLSDTYQEKVIELLTLIKSSPYSVKQVVRNFLNSNKNCTFLKNNFRDLYLNDLEFFCYRLRN